MNGVFADNKDDALREVAQRLCWWLSPEQALLDVQRFVAQVMALGTWEDVCTVQRRLGETTFGQVLDRPPAGVFSARRWNYWNVRCGRLPVPLLPRRFAESSEPPPGVAGSKAQAV